MNNQKLLSFIGRSQPLITDIRKYEDHLSSLVQDSSFLVIGGAGSIGQAVVKEIFKREPKKLHVVDISENNLAELVRDIRSSFGYINGEFKTFVIDAGSLEFEIYFQDQEPFEYVLNLSALKHVRSEKDPYTLMRMVNVNILNTINTIELAVRKGAKKYFCVSTDKAANPVNMMGASKRIMEMFLYQYGNAIPISTARFANVAFSDGSLLHSFQQRLLKDQPIVAPRDIRRYFVTPEESGEICLMSTLLGNNGEIFFPKLNQELNMITFTDIAERFLHENGYEPFLCENEDEARARVLELKQEKKWACYFSVSDTTGEKAYEEFFVEGEDIDLNRFDSLGVVINSAHASENELGIFLDEVSKMKTDRHWTRELIIALFNQLLPEFSHDEKGKFLDEKM